MNYINNLECQKNVKIVGIGLEFPNDLKKGGVGLNGKNSFVAVSFLYYFFDNHSWLFLIFRRDFYKALSKFSMLTIKGHSIQMFVAL